MKFYHVVHIYQALDSGTKRRMAFAQSTWRKFSNWVILEHYLLQGDRNATAIGERPLPFMRDVIERFLDQIPDDGVIVFTNSDNCLVPETEDVLNDWFEVQKRKHCWSCRYDFQKVSYVMNRQKIKNGRFYRGKDLFAFYKWWWLSIDFPDMILGCPTWDWLLFQIMGEKSEIRPVVYHERHDAFWHRGGHGNTWNSNLAKEYAQKHGFGHCIKGEHFLNDCGRQLPI